MDKPAEQDDPRDKRLLIEYELAQQSAEHHDTLLWEVTSIIWGANTLMLGFAFEAPTDNHTIQWRVFLAAIVGICLSLLAHLNARMNRGVRNRKYVICQEIEKELGLEKQQHNNELKKYPRGTQTMFHLVMTIIFVLVWAVIAYQSGHGLFCY